tara:strand:+ start:243 stop:521 length:279 start_codon:yes stop_codon:yes gene_type:complete
MAIYITKSKEETNAPNFPSDEEVAAIIEKTNRELLSKQYLKALRSAIRTLERHGISAHTVSKSYGKVEIKINLQLGRDGLYFTPTPDTNGDT